ncbi:unnamed protein product [Adineta steineri]|uniref:Apple domain-containing protein n=1 Tax=Adineta steineri TaxID=433720 RepID=A0A818ZWJ2_9BILA|nr:unnamed protein product [Adineta steineri]CAF1289018.1 unnamed protein product [Adineta steineri]CAF3774931.1 unnamed protein product [Adineta steineri]CAF4128068.1 unnamed protein product [Adineta steineri]
MQSSIIAFILVGIVIISQTSAKTLYNDDDFEDELVRALSSMKRGATYNNLPTSSRCTQFISGKDYGGGDMNANYPAQVRSPAACAALCEEYPDCIAWTFNVKSAKCWVKSTLPALGSGTDTYTGSCTKSSK